MMRPKAFLLTMTAASGAMALAGCQTTKPKAEPEPPTPVVVATPPPPVVVVTKPPPPPPPPPKSCVPRTLAPPPRYPDSDAALRNAPGAADRYQLLAAGRIVRQERLAELERVIAGCR